MRETGKEANEIDMEDVFEGFRRKARDHARVPMQVALLVPKSEYV